MLPTLSFASDITDIEKKYQKAEDKQKIPYLKQLAEYYPREAPNKAIIYANEALELLKEWPNTSDELAIKYALFDAHKTLGELEQAYTIAQESNHLAIKSGTQDELATTHFALGSIFRDKDNNYNESIKHFKIASAIFLDLSDMYSYAVSMNSIGLVHYYDTNYDEALAYYLKALEIKEFAKDDAHTYANIGMIHYKYKRWSEMIRYYDIALEQAKKIDRKHLISKQLINLGMAYSFNSENDKAIDYLNQASVIEKEVGNITSLFEIAVRLGEIYVDKKQYKLAKQYYDEALILSTQTETPILSIQINMAIGKLYKNLTQYELALVYTQKALINAENIGKKPRISEAHKNLSDIYLGKNNFEKALVHIKKHFALKEENYEDSRLKTISQLEEKYKANLRNSEIEQLKSNKLLDSLKNKQKEIYASLIFIVLIVIGSLLMFLQNKKSQLAVKKSTMLAELMDKKNQLLADVSHELGTPLTVLKLQVEALKDNIEDDVQATYNSLDNKLDDIQHLIGDIHQLAQADNGLLQLHKQEFDIKQTMEIWYADFREYVNETDLTFTLTNKLNSEQFVNFDRDKIKQVITNLLANSAKYTDSPGNIELVIQQINEQLTIEVKDSKPGVSDNDLTNIFERLYRIESSRNRETGGAGLGLAICKSLVEAHNGNIHAEQSSLGGLKITIELPLN
jgi:signal transduction histidine kinase